MWCDFSLYPIIVSSSTGWISAEYQGCTFALLEGAPRYCYLARRNRVIDMTRVMTSISNTCIWGCTRILLGGDTQRSCKRQGVGSLQISSSTVQSVHYVEDAYQDSLRQSCRAVPFVHWHPQCDLATREWFEVSQSNCFKGSECCSDCVVRAAWQDARPIANGSVPTGQQG